MEHRILIVEDDNNDRWFGALAFESVGLGRSVSFAVDGQEAIDYLGGMGKYLDRSRFPLPNIILLDLNLPKVCGLEVLKWIRSQPQFHSTHIIILTSSAMQSDISAAHDAGVTDYLIKPLQLGQWRTMAQYIQTSWLPAPAFCATGVVLADSHAQSLNA